MNRVIFFLLSSPVLLSSFRPHIHYNNQARDIKMSDDEFAQWLSGFTDAVSRRKLGGGSEIFIY